MQRTMANSEKKAKKRNFTQCETEVLVGEVEARKNTFGGHSVGITNAKKTRVAACDGGSEWCQLRRSVNFKLFLEFHPSAIRVAVSHISSLCACIHMGQSYCEGRHILPSSLFSINPKVSLESGAHLLLCLRNIYTWGSWSPECETPQSDYPL